MFRLETMIASPWRAALRANGSQRIRADQEKLAAISGEYAYIITTRFQGATTGIVSEGASSTSRSRTRAGRTTCSQSNPGAFGPTTTLRNLGCGGSNPGGSGRGERRRTSSKGIGSRCHSVRMECTTRATPVRTPSRRRTSTPSRQRRPDPAAAATRGASATPWAGSVMRPSIDERARPSCPRRRLSRRHEHHGDGEGQNSASRECAPTLRHELLVDLLLDPGRRDEQALSRVAANRAMNVPELIGALDLVLVVLPGGLDRLEAGTPRDSSKQRHAVESRRERCAFRHVDGATETAVDDAIQQIGGETPAT